MTADGVPAGGFAGAVRAGPGRLRVARRRPACPGRWPASAPSSARAVEETADLLRSLGHDVGDVEVDYGPACLRRAW